MRIQTVIAASILWGGSFPASSQAPVEAISVTVVLPSSYPAFEAERPRGAPLRAVVILKAADGGSTVLLNPAYANPHTLYEALSIVRRMAPSAKPGDPSGYIVIGQEPRVRAPSGAVASRLARFLASVRSAEQVRIDGQRTEGRMGQLSDAWEFFPDLRSSGPVSELPATTAP